MPDFDLIVIGSGPAGEKGAAQAAYFGKKVALVERHVVLGGARIHNCALPSKALREMALQLSGFRQRESDAVQVRLRANRSLTELMCHRESVIDQEAQRVAHNLARHHIEVVPGEAQFVDAHTLRVRASKRASRTLSADVILIAAGSHPTHPPGIPFSDGDVLDTDKLLKLDRLPRSLLIVGAGVIGCEYASILAPLGVRVTLIDKKERLLPFADGEVSRLLVDSFRHLGIDVRLGADAESVELVTLRRRRRGIRTRLKGGDTLVTSQVLYCAGRDGNTAPLNLESAGLEADARGRLRVNERFQTAVPHIYAAGDVLGFPGLASTGMEQARVAMCHAFDLKYKTRVSPILPLGIYTIPELSLVGESEESARAKGIDYEVGRAFYKDNPRGQLAGDIGGLLKLVFNAADKRLLGAHIVGERATEIIHVASTCLQYGASIDGFIDAVFNYPTLSELYKYAAYDGLGRLRADSRRNEAGRA